MVGELLPPHDTENNRNSVAGTAEMKRRLRVPTKRPAEPNNRKAQVSGHAVGGKALCHAVQLVTGAVVPTFTVTVCVPLPLICTDELDRLQVGAGVAAGVTVQLRLTVPVNDPIDENAKLKLAVCPALMVCDVDDPEDDEMLKSGAATPSPDRGIVCGLPEALSLIVTPPARCPVVVGVNVIAIWQLPPTAIGVLQVFVSAKSPEAAIWVMMSDAFPVLTRVTTF